MQNRSERCLNMPYPKYSNKQGALKEVRWCWKWICHIKLNMTITKYDEGTKYGKWVLLAKNTWTCYPQHQSYWQVKWIDNHLVAIYLVIICKLIWYVPVTKCHQFPGSENFQRPPSEYPFRSELFWLHNIRIMSFNHVVVRCVCMEIPSQIQGSFIQD